MFCHHLLLFSKIFLRDLSLSMCYLRMYASNWSISSWMHSYQFLFLFCLVLQEQNRPSVCLWANSRNWKNIGQVQEQSEIISKLSLFPVASLALALSFHYSLCYKIVLSSISHSVPDEVQPLQQSTNLRAVIISLLLCISQSQEWQCFLLFLISTYFLINRVPSVFNNPCNQFPGLNFL